MPTLAVPLYEEKKLDLPGRNPLLPDIYEARNHPKPPLGSQGRCFIIKYDTSRIAMKDMRDFEETLKVPLGQRKELELQGLLELKAGDYLFGRAGLENKDPRGDGTTCWAVGAEQHSEAARDGLDEATDLGLGPKETRTADRVPLEEGAERVGSGRCYNIAMTVELPTGCIAPQASMKPSDKCAKFHKMVRVLSKAIAKMAMEDMELAPEDLKSLIRRRTEMLGLPRVGCHENYAYQTIQCNIAAAQGAASLAEQLALFGEAHFDCKDCPGHTTNMQVASQLPAHWDPGYFHVLGLGIFVALDKHVSFNFQGNRKHGASGPFPPDGETDIPSWAYRFTLISYPPSRMCNQTCRFRIGATPGTVPFYLAPEMQNPEIDPMKVLGTGSANMLRDARHFMDNKSIAEFGAQTVYRLCNWFLKQMPTELGLERHNTDNFFTDLSYLDESGTRVALEPWKWAPPLGGAQEQEFMDRWRRETQEWDEHVEKASMLIPARSLRSVSVSAERTRQSFDHPSGEAGPSSEVSNPPSGTARVTRVNAEAGPSRISPRTRATCWVEIPHPATSHSSAKRPRETEEEAGPVKRRKGGQTLQTGRPRRSARNRPLYGVRFEDGESDGSVEEDLEGYGSGMGGDEVEGEEAERKVSAVKTEPRTFSKAFHTTRHQAPVSSSPLSSYCTLSRR
ncbi:hypothetical protein DFP72DRAFT_473889 [Ephemerocybe angulata]|uniref:Uncharacterized protein n=1 Tax=Ephemerocybe angulata TaxID=980116 RepID=A0A8H6HTU4_9AGAR|nr:hypothetical protein DFP72DRAFT_473889 [Tulosesus angulatus]